jgi:hypothetical protein
MSAQANWEARQYPRAVDYTVTVAVDDGGALRYNHYNSSYDAVANDVRVDPVSAEERAHPYVAKGINLRLQLNLCMGLCQLLKPVPLNKPQQPPDYIGVPVLAPNYNFGIAPYILPQPRNDMKIVAQIRDEYRDPMPPEKARAAGGNSELKVIGDVRAVSRTYVISYAGLETIDGTAAYHLALRPTHDPQRYRLRDLWVDTKTFATLQLVSAGNFMNDGAWAVVPWTVRYAQIGGANYIATERAGMPLHVAGLTYSGVTISFENIESVRYGSVSLPHSFVAPRELMEPM